MVVRCGVNPSLTQSHLQVAKANVAVGNQGGNDDAAEQGGLPNAAAGQQGGLPNQNAGDWQEDGPMIIQPEPLEQEGSDAEKEALDWVECDGCRKWRIVDHDTYEQTNLSSEQDPNLQVLVSSCYSVMCLTSMCNPRAGEV